MPFLQSPEGVARAPPTTMLLRAMAVDYEPLSHLFRTYDS